MRSKFLMGVMLSLPLLIASCGELLFPIHIANTPEWLKGKHAPGRGPHSSWNDWPGENHPLATLLSPQEADKKRYDGSFQIVFVRSNPQSRWTIEFSDGTVSTFTLWLGLDYGTSYITIPQHWLPELHYLIEMGDYNQTPSSPYSIYTSSSPQYVYYISGEITKTNPYTALRQEEIDDTQKRVLYSVYGASPDSSLYYIEAHRNTRETVVFRFMDKEKGILEEGTGWISRQEDLDTW